MAQLQLTQDAAADTLLSEDPFALLMGMMLDQQVRTHLQSQAAAAGALKMMRLGVYR